MVDRLPVVIAGWKEIFPNAIREMLFAKHRHVQVSYCVDIADQGVLVFLASFPWIVHGLSDSAAKEATAVEI